MPQAVKDVIAQPRPQVPMKGTWQAAGALSGLRTPVSLSAE